MYFASQKEKDCMYGYRQNNTICIFNYYQSESVRFYILFYKAFIKLCQPLQHKTKHVPDWTLSLLWFKDKTVITKCISLFFTRNFISIIWIEKHFTIKQRNQRWQNGHYIIDYIAKYVFLKLHLASNSMWYVYFLHFVGLLVGLVVGALLLSCVVILTVVLIRRYVYIKLYF